MLKELFESISDQAVAARGARVVNTPAEPAHIYLIEKADGTIQPMTAEPAVRANTAQDLATIVAFAESDKSEVWVSRSAVVLYVDGAVRRDKVTMPLELSHQVKQLVEMEKVAKPRQQPETIRFLRVDMYGCLGRAEGLIALLRRLKWSVTNKADTQIKHGSASLGRSIEEEVTGVSALPEYVEFDVPIWNGSFPGIRGVVTCAVDLDAGAETITLLPARGLVEARLCAAEQEVVSMLREDLETAKKAVPVYYGNP